MCKGMYYRESLGDCLRDCFLVQFGFCSHGGAGEIKLLWNYVVSVAIFMVAEDGFQL